MGVEDTVLAKDDNKNIPSEYSWDYSRTVKLRYPGARPKMTGIPFKDSDNGHTRSWIGLNICDQVISVRFNNGPGIIVPGEMFIQLLFAVQSELNKGNDATLLLKSYRVMEQHLRQVKQRLSKAEMEFDEDATATPEKRVAATERKE
ncbi:hypothetical protein BU17DRAFT_65038 [Hysterangium stoloniferum]|nr:hypothetical protein BU17DRAFT_65038 [Hysterangium stoloniferum]